jgi:hypothetical protein
LRLLVPRSNDTSELICDIVDGRLPTKELTFKFNSIKLDRLQKLSGIDPLTFFEDRLILFIPCALQLIPVQVHLLATLVQLQSGIFVAIFVAAISSHTTVFSRAS